MTIAFRDGPLRLYGQLLIYPCVDTDFEHASYRSEANAPYLKAAGMIRFWSQYCPEAGQQRQDPLVVPMLCDDPDCRRHSSSSPSTIRSAMTVTLMRSALRRPVFP